MSYHHWFRPIYAVSQQHVSMSQLIQKRLYEIICELNDPAACAAIFKHKEDPP